MLGLGNSIEDAAIRTAWRPILPVPPGYSTLQGKAAGSVVALSGVGSNGIRFNLIGKSS